MNKLRGSRSNITPSLAFSGLCHGGLFFEHNPAALAGCLIIFGTLMVFPCAGTVANSQHLLRQRLDEVFLWHELIPIAADKIPRGIVS